MVFSLTLMFWLLNLILVKCYQDQKGAMSNNSTIQQCDRYDGDANEVKSIYTRSNLIARRMEINYVDFDAELEKRGTENSNMIDFSWGFPDYMPPNHVLDALVEVAMNRNNPDSYLLHQYERQSGNERLVKVLAKFYSMLMKRQLNWETEIIVTTGASHALKMICEAHINPGDEVILFEPFYAFYYKIIRLSGGQPIYAQIKPRNGKNSEKTNEWSFDRQELASKFSNKTKFILVNNPNNPSGKTFTEDELTFIGDLADKHNVIIVADEVSQWYYYDDQPHIRIATLKNFWKRTITINSGGKTFSNTGWRIGWAIAPEELIWGLSAMTENTVFCVSSPIQIAFAMGMETELKRWNTSESYFKHMRDISIKGRNRLISILKTFGAHVTQPNAGYFVMANVTRWAQQMDLSKENDPRPGMRLNIALRKQFGINSIPLTIFYSPQNERKFEYVLRLPLIKTDSAFDELEKRLKKHFKPIKDNKIFSLDSWSY